MKESSHYIVPTQLCDLLHRRYVESFVFISLIAYVDIMQWFLDCHCT